MKLKVLTILFAIIFSATSALAAKEKEKKQENSEETMRLLSLFGDVFEKVKQDYVEDVTDDKLIESAINGMLTSLDPHSSYMNEKQFAEMQIQTKGEFGGLGIEVTMDNGLVKVVSPIDDTPAFKAGIQAGDFISEIDGTPVLGMNLTEAIDKLRGRVGSKVKLTVLRKGEKEPLDIEIVRDIIKIKSIRSHKEGNDVAYIRITSFSEQTDRNFRAEFDKLKKEMGDNLKGLVIDMRNNPGGLLDQAIAIADFFLESGEIVSTKGRIADSTKLFHAKEGDITGGIPIVVLINSGSASASEIVAGALKDHKRAVVMGTQSFGKGSVQTVIPLPDDGAMRLTTSRYYTPSGVAIQAKGIEPDIVVEPAKIEFLKTKENAEADLVRHLNNDQDGEDDKQKDKDEVKTEDQLLRNSSSDKSLYDKDYQLARAVDLLRAINVFNSSIKGKKLTISKE